MQSIEQFEKFKLNLHSHSTHSTTARGLLHRTMSTILKNFMVVVVGGEEANPIKTTAIVVACGTTVLAMTAMTSLVMLLRTISESVGVAPPTKKQLEEENSIQRCALFRHFPSLTNNLAWRSNMVTVKDIEAMKTPIHVCTYPNRDGIQFYVKREDLISKEYGGNKVRTLQHLLGVCESRLESGDAACKQLVSIGSGGSNQVIATVVHARKLGWTNEKKDEGERGNSVNACWLDPDLPDLDNTLNYLSVLSFPNVDWIYNWGMKFQLRKAVSAIKGALIQNTFLPIMLGGNCPAGVLGQAGGVLELAEQIEAGDSPDIERIYLPIGSGCTVSGLILGTVMVRHLGLKALSDPKFKIVGCNVHEKFALLNRLIGLHTNPLFGFMPLTITYSVIGACKIVKQIGGPDLEPDCRQFIIDHVEIKADADVVGLYGGHSELSREAAQYYDEVGIVTDIKTDQKEKELWVCGHFVAKALQPLIKDLEASAAASGGPSKEGYVPPNYMLWQTKSAIQPKGPVDEWELMIEQSEAVKKWANDGKAESMKYRPGKVVIDDDKTGKPEDYRSIMTKIA